MANLSNINNKFLVTTGGNVLIGQTGAVGSSIFQVTGSVNITGGTTSGLNITTSGTQDTININRAASNDNAMTKYQTASADKWIVGLRNTSDDNFRFYSYGTSSDVLTINQGNGSATFAGTVIGTIARFDTLNNSANSKNLIYRDSSGAKTIVGGGSTPDKIYILDGGNVGIGASLPTQSKLVISGGATGTVGGGDAGITMINKFDNPDNSWSILPVITGVSNTGFSIRDNTDSADRLVIDGSGNVGIGTSSPDTLLNIEGSSPILTIEDSRISIGDGTIMGRIDFKQNDNSGSGTGVSGSIYSISSSATGQGSDLAFTTGVPGSTTEKMRIQSTTGNIAISGNGIQIDRPDVAGGKPYIFWKSGGTTQASIYGASSGTGLRIFLSGGTAAFDNSISFTGIVQQNAQSVVLSNSAYANAAAVQAYATNTANVYPGYGFHKASQLGGFLYATSRTELRYRGDGGTDKVLLMADSDYEQGTWTPTLKFSNASTGITYGGAAGTVYRGGHYTKIGRVVTFSVRIILTSKGTSAGDATITGLPFDVGVQPANYGSAMYSFANNFLIPLRPTITMDSSSSIIRLRFVNSPNGNYGNVTNSDFNNNSDIILTGTYQTT